MCLQSLNPLFIVEFEEKKEKSAKAKVATSLDA